VAAKWIAGFSHHSHGNEASMRMLITGASGFVGRAILDAAVAEAASLELFGLARGARPADLPDRIRWLRTDLLLPDAARELISRVQPDVLIHSAWHTAAGDYLDHPANAHWLAASLRLLDGFLEAGGQRFVSIGSCAEYSRSIGPCHESRTPTHSESTYGAHKAQLARHILQRLEESPGSLAHARLFFLYGAREKQNRLVPYLISNLLASRVASIGVGDRVRDYMNVRDAGAALLSLAQSQVSGVINIASGSPTRIDAIAHFIADRLGVPDRLEIGRREESGPGAKRIVADVTRQTHELGFHPQVSLQQGLDELIELARSHTTPLRTREAVPLSSGWAP